MSNDCICSFPGPASWLGLTSDSRDLIVIFGKADQSRLTDVDWKCVN